MTLVPRTRRASLVLERRRDVWEARGDTAARLGGAPGDEPEPLFAEWAWDGRRLRIASDRYGIVPAFVYFGADRIVLSSTLADVVSAVSERTPPHLDEDALAVLLRLGWFVGDDTPIAGVRRLPPGVDVEWDSRDRAEAPSEPTGGPFIPARCALDRDGALDAYVELFRDAVHRRLPSTGPSRIVLPLSGGRDSRHILFALHDIGATPDELVTVRHVPPKPDEDARVAAVLARELGVAHRVIDRSENRVRDERRKNLLTHFAAPGTHAWSLPLVDHLSAYGGPLFDGFGGDLLSMARYLDPEEIRLYRENRLRDLAERLLGDERRIETAVPAELRCRLGRERAAVRLERELARHVDAANPIRSFRFWTYGRRLIALSPCGLLGGHRIRLPYLDERLFDVLAGLPPEVLLPEGGHFHTAAIARGYPRFADLPYEDKRAPLVHDRRYHGRAARDALRYLARCRTAGDLHSPRYVVPRLLRVVADPRYAPTAAWLVPRAVYSAQLRRLMDAAVRADTTSEGIDEV